MDMFSFEMVEFELPFDPLSLLGELVLRASYDSTSPVQVYPNQIVSHPIITTPYGPKQVTRIEKRGKNNSLGGMAIPDFDTYLVNSNSVFPKDYVDHHERNHLRDYEEIGIPVIDELINREISDRQYRKITCKNIDTVSPYERKMEENLIERYGKDDAKNIMREVRSIKEQYVRRNETSVDIADIAREFEEDRKREEIVKKKIAPISYVV